jgi:hypothetical protein
VAEFDPRQLDQLEDALEHLDDHDLADHDDSLELPAELIERLSEYQDVLALCRDAFPLESPPEELLIGVIAEAREVSRRPRTRDVDRYGGWRRFWERWRGTVVPGFALATTAVVVLWVLDPAADLEQVTELSSSSELEDRSVEAELERTQAAGESSNTAKADEPERADQPGQTEQPAVEPPDPTSDEQGSDAIEAIQPKPKTSEKAPTKSKLDDTYEPAPEPAPTPMSKDETWTNLERADSLRRAGNCDRARSTYDDVIAASSDASAIGQAKAGIGLCFEQDRRDSEAAKWFEDARGDSPGIDAWIDDQRDEQPLPGESKKPSSKKSQAMEADAL